MSSRKVLAAVVLLSAASFATAQNAPHPPDRPGRGPGGMRDHGGNNGNPLKEALELSDEQWKQVQPKLDRVQQLRRDLSTTNGFGMGGGPGMMGRPGMGGPPGGFGGGPGGGGRPGGAGGPRGGGDHFAAGAPTTRPAQDHANTDGLPPAQDGFGDFREHGPQGPRADFGPGGGGPGRAGGHVGFGGPGQMQPDAKPSAVRKRLDDLQDALDDKDAKPEDVRAKLDAYHKARADAVAELATAQEDLRKILNPTQEAVLITAGILD